eukprot:CAMPEP_0194092252 /NCGR_PEP_ID=MMETSP0149-20130528/46041_1 /TAXON_ID=122233 /ORGANISM="Chaetoceros debilis, Strain MM31A-1" /LENGTH=537 /DNA_ID=CAMNT_0038777139 /DNA_START=121 /DNA_END=1734 /DNA_ORIENTATION=-
MSATRKVEPTPSEEKNHVHFNKDDISWKEGKEHTTHSKTPKPEPPHVHFDKNDISRKEVKEHIDYPKTRKLESSHPAKVKVSKEDFILHIKIGAALILFFVGGTAYFSTKSKKAESVAKSVSMMDEIAKMVQKELELDLLLVDPSYPNLSEQIIRLPSTSLKNGSCNTFLADSSIAGLGLFTTKSYEVGEEIVSIMGGNQVIDLGDGLVLPLSSISMKQHSSYSNVIENKNRKGSIEAKRPIEAGEELFMSFDDFDPKYEEIYYNKLHPDDPTVADYDRVDKIIRDSFDSIPTKTLYVDDAPTRKQYKQKQKNKKSEKKIPTVDLSIVFQLLRNVVKVYDEKLATLIPDTTIEARSILEAGGRERFISNHRSVDWITSNGICVDGLVAGASTISKEKGVFASRDTAVGDIITTAPVLAIEKGGDLDLENRLHCIGAPVKGISLCPLSLASDIQNGLSEGCDIKNQECPNNKANAKLQWSSFNLRNKNLDSILKEEFIQRPFPGVTIDVIATRSIQQGEELFIDYSVYETFSLKGDYQ